MPINRSGASTVGKALAGTALDTPVTPSRSWVAVVLNDLSRLAAAHLLVCGRAPRGILDATQIRGIFQSSPPGP